VDGEKFKFKHVEGQLLLRYAGRRLPDVMGDDKFDISQRSMADDGTTLFRRALRSYSPIIQKHQKPCFGDISNWREDKNEGGTTWNMINPELEIEIKLDSEAVFGSFWPFAMMVHPGSPWPATIAELDEYVWSLAEKFGWTDELKKICHLDQRKGRVLTRKKKE